MKLQNKNSPEDASHIPGLQGTVLLLWGWQTGFWWPGLLLGVILEGRRWVDATLEIPPRSLHRLADISALLLIGALVYSFRYNENESFIIGMVRLWPIILFPLVATAVYSDYGRCPLDAVFFSLRHKSIPQGSSVTINLTWPYAGICLIAAGCSHEPNFWYFPLAVVWTGWALWSFRSPRYSVFVWGGCLLIVASGGLTLHTGLHKLQEILNKEAVSWLAEMWLTALPEWQSTAMGRVGKLKQSDRIMFRVRQESFPWQIPLLLREVSMNLAVDTNWQAVAPGFIPLPQGQEPHSWILNQTRKDSPHILRLFKRLPAGDQVLPLPLGAMRMTELPAQHVAINQYGVVKTTSLEEIHSFRVVYDPKVNQEGLPDKWDLQVPKSEQPILSRIVTELGLASRPPQETLTILNDYFYKNFRYSTLLTRSEAHYTPLSDFLTNTHSGHCEYFASATVLLLRQAGIPSRYAVGYSVQEFNDDEHYFIVRARHAHAWALAYINGQWQNVDNTPPDWSSLEEQQAPFWTPWLDWWSALWFKHAPIGDQEWLLKGLTILILWSGLVMMSKRFPKSTRIRRRVLRLKKPDQHPFALIEHHFAQTGQGRYPGETLQNWIQRIHALSLHPWVQLHYATFYDPQAHDKEEQWNTLTMGLAKWLTSNQNKNH